MWYELSFVETGHLDLIAEELFFLFELVRPISAGGFTSTFQPLITQF